MNPSFSKPMRVVMSAVGIIAAATAPSAADSSRAPTSPPLVSGEITADAGVVDPGQQSDVEHVFDFKNITNHPLTVTGVRGTCGCEHMALLQNGKDADNLVVAPNGSFQVRFGVNLFGQPSGKIVKTAWITGGPTAAQNIATLHLVFTIQPPFSFDPPRLDLGVIAPGATSTGTVTVTTEKVLNGKDGQYPTLIANSPNVAVEPVGPAKTAVQNGKDVVIAQYKITTARIPVIGSFHSDLQLTSSRGNGKHTTLIADLPVICNVVGNIQVAPKGIFFGTAIQGQATSRSVIVSGKTPSDVAALNVTADASWIKPQPMGSAPASDNGISRVVVLTLAPDAPAGLQQTFVTISAGPNDTIRVPVSANVVAPQ